MSRTALILGGGIAGLTAAWDLVATGHSDPVIEEAATGGGRLRGAPPPLLLEAHDATWALLRRLDKDVATRRLRHSPLEFLQSNGARIQFLHLPLPSPLNTLLGTTLFQGLSMRDRWHLLSFLERTWEQDPPLPNDLDLRAADEWLAGIGQSESARAGVWNCLARLLLGASLRQVSAALFMRTLRRCFLTGAKATKLILPSQGLDSFLLTPLKARLDAMGVQFRLSTSVTHLQFDKDRVVRVESTDRTAWTADDYVAALPRHRLTPLLPERIITHYAYFQQLGRLSESPMVIVRLHVDHVQERTQIVLLERQTFHWMIRHPDRQLHEQASVVWAVAVEAGHLLSESDDTLVRLAVKDMEAAFPTPSSPRLLQTEVMRQPQSYLMSKPATQQYRPLPRSPFSNFFVAGDWTDTGWPANLESAIMSGQRCAEVLSASL
ncbi:MAG TPA: FAD-dependent oxidoreductase [Nitrospira sp.]|nr:FAD-dependent oxidoreductase [Nitrospira sp.]